MVLRVAVADPLPFFRRGVMAALAEAGYDAEAPDDVVAWAAVPETRIVVFTVEAPGDWVTLTTMCQGPPGNAVIAVLDRPSVPTYTRALAAGAVSALPRDAAPAVLRDIFAAAAEGRSLIPTEVLRALLRPEARAQEEAEGTPTADERSWLRHLAGGGSVARLAGQAGYSERMMFRLLRDLYAKLGVRTRTEALIRARDQGWL